MINYLVDVSVLRNYLPRHTEPDLFEGKCLVSLVGFQFLKTRILGIPIPFHRNFEEFNLRFYVTYTENGVVKRGAVFVSEIVPRYAIPLVANTLYREHYSCLPMRSAVNLSDDRLDVLYGFKAKKRWNTFEATASPVAVPFAEHSVEEFITEHYWGYNRWTPAITLEYAVEHPSWTCYPVTSCKIDCDFSAVYPLEFVPYLEQEPHSVLLAEGSPVIVRKGTSLP